MSINDRLVTEDVLNRYINIMENMFKQSPEISEEQVRAMVVSLNMGKTAMLYDMDVRGLLKEAGFDDEGLAHPGEQ